MEWGFFSFLPHSNPSCENGNAGDSPVVYSKGKIMTKFIFWFCKPFGQKTALRGLFLWWKIQCLTFKRTKRGKFVFFDEPKYHATLVNFFVTMREVFEKCPINYDWETMLTSEIERVIFLEFVFQGVQDEIAAEKNKAS